MSQVPFSILDALELNLVRLTGCSGAGHFSHLGKSVRESGQQTTLPGNPETVEVRIMAILVFPSDRPSGPSSPRKLGCVSESGYWSVGRWGCMRGVGLCVGTWVDGARAGVCCPLLIGEVLQPRRDGQELAGAAVRLIGDGRISHRPRRSLTERLQRTGFLGCVTPGRLPSADPLGAVICNRFAVGNWSEIGGTVGEMSGFGGPWFDNGMRYGYVSSHLSPHTRGFLYATLSG